MTSSHRTLAFMLLGLPFSALGCGGADSSAQGAAGGAGIGGSGGARPCNELPFTTCPAGQTCWVVDKTTSSFGCFNSLKGAGKGVECDNIPGKPACDDGLMCLASDDKGHGTCVSFCDPKDAKHACDPGELCSAIHYGTAGSGGTATFPAFVYACDRPGGGGGAGAGGGNQSGAAGKLPASCRRDEPDLCPRCPWHPALSAPSPPSSFSSPLRLPWRRATSMRETPRTR